MNSYYVLHARTIIKLVLIEKLFTTIHPRGRTIHQMTKKVKGDYSLLAEIETMQKCIKASFVSEIMFIKLIGICEYNKDDYVNFDLLTIKELDCFLANGIIISGVVKIHPIYRRFLAIFDPSYYHLTCFLMVLSHYEFSHDMRVLR